MIGKTISHYRVIECLGSGGMGVVYKAQDLRLGRHVALKFLSHDLCRDEQSKQRFLHEARAASALDHPNLAAVHEIDETDDGQLFIVMTCYEGVTLKQRIEQGPVEPEEAIDIALQVARGLSRAHEEGIVHRDIKPANIIVTKRGEVKIVDFGLVKLAGGTRLTKSHSAPGTAAYMSPEQVQGLEVDHRTDIWSLGIVLYEMLTGSRPFRGDYAQVVLYSIVNEPPDLNVDFGFPESDPLRAVIKKALAKEPEARYQSAESFISDLERVRSADGLAVQVGGATLHGPQLGKLLRKKRWLAVVAAIVAISAFVWQSRFNSPLSLAPNHTVVITEFTNNSSEAYFDHSLTEALRVTLRQSSYLNVMSRQQTTAALERMALPPGHPLDLATAVAVARREGAGLVISGGIERIGVSYVLTSKIIDAGSGETLKMRRIEVSRVEKVLSGMDRLARNVRKDLGESLQLISQSSRPLDKVTTGSLEALELYSRGNRLEAQGEYADAIKLKEDALKLDSLFAMAVSDLSYDYRKIGNRKKALFYHRRVLPLLDRVTERERLAMLVTYYGPSFELDYAQAYNYANEWTLLFPNDAIGHATSAHLAMFAGDYDAALRENRRAMELDSSLAGVTYSNSAFTEALAGRADQALEFFHQSKRLRPGYLALDGYIAQAHWMRGELDSAEQTFRNILRSGDPMRKAKTHAHLAALYFFKGQLRSALAECRAGIRSCRQGGHPDEAAYFHYMIGEMERERGQIAESRRELKQAIGLCSSPFYELGLAGAGLASMGYDRDAEALLSRLTTIESDDPYFRRLKASYSNYIRGELAFRANQFQEALEFYSKVGRIYRGDPFYLLARERIARCTAKLLPSRAIELYQNLLAVKGESTMAFLASVRNGGLWTSRLWPEALLELGQLYANAHDTTHAVRCLEDVLRFWHDADPSYARAGQARSLLSKLQGTY